MSSVVSGLLARFRRPLQASFIAMLLGFPSGATEQCPKVLSHLSRIAGRTLKAHGPGILETPPVSTFGRDPEPARFRFRVGENCEWVGIRSGGGGPQPDDAFTEVALLASRPLDSARRRAALALIDVVEAEPERAETWVAYALLTGDAVTKLPLRDIGDGGAENLQVVPARKLLGQRRAYVASRPCNFLIDGESPLSLEAECGLVVPGGPVRPVGVLHQDWEVLEVGPSQVARQRSTGTLMVLRGLRVLGARRGCFVMADSQGLWLTDVEHHRVLPLGPFDHDSVEILDTEVLLWRSAPTVDEVGGTRIDCATMIASGGSAGSRAISRGTALAVATDAGAFEWLGQHLIDANAPSHALPFARAIGAAGSAPPRYVAPVEHDPVEFPLVGVVVAEKEGRAWVANAFADSAAGLQLSLSADLANINFNSNGCGVCLRVLESASLKSPVRALQLGSASLAADKLELFYLLRRLRDEPSDRDFRAEACSAVTNLKHRFGEKVMRDLLIARSGECGLIDDVAPKAFCQLAAQSCGH